ncbi:hypothetical protein D7147_20010 [Micromonospora musae]|uniref:Uncharacterized protein n=1 Tax=Micromonospora musae TaxID=1894970 RepID=A0ABX9R236_9ACTN|nr:DUF6114 domain-containing protein [Micromonospora musae]RKN16970.1 hypothetical protein D7147_20010 [Micromonospora musae]
MTTAESQEARTGPSGWLGRAWRGFRRWRRQRPFWGGLFTMLAGLVIFGSTQMSLNGLVFKMGPTGFLTWLIPAILITCGLLFWFSPAQRTFYAVVAAITAVYSLIGVNLGGFFLGLLLGMVGSALGFAWVPSKTPAAPTKTEEPSEAEAGHDREAGTEPADVDDAALVDELMPRQRDEEPTGVLADVPPPPRNPLREPAPAEPSAKSGAETRQGPDVDPQPPAGGRHRGPKTYAILLVVTVSAAAGLVGFRSVEPAAAAPACPRPTATAEPTVKPSASGSPSPSTSSAAPAPDEPSDGNLLTDIVDGITGLITGDDSDDPDENREASPSTATRPGAGAASTPTRAASPGVPSAKPGKPARDTCGTPAPGRPKPVEVGKPLPRVATDPDVPKVAAKPGKLTGSKQTMTGLHFAGIAELDTADGKLKTLMFTMDKAVTNDFVLKVGGPRGKTVRYVTEQLTVKGEVAFYATRYVGRLAGVKVTLTPDLPFPDGIPVTSPVPITFTDVEVDLAYIACDTLTAKKPAGPLHIDLA